jgi:hypothetical protein
MSHYAYLTLGTQEGIGNERRKGKEGGAVVKNSGSRNSCMIAVPLGSIVDGGVTAITSALCWGRISIGNVYENIDAQQLQYGGYWGHMPLQLSS